ncbi:hypothetical protein IQ266_23380 [filamentous cyanobacterium LEGE 11480]|uniref:Uncharacterized protein n=1 Tax=Romeriopsis navalis LEGE 11480 TaxID=2777977 RepID=A0A928VQ29_9CYAN|nr:hypothetical protein [Romeriopsis navalis]MBE9032683.1 hypothetical protein [Romeriopsis navalis LEGE 11480]
MSISSHASEIPAGAAANPEVWNGLKLAIAGSTGFERWKQDRKVDAETSETSLDALVHRYLRETLETLAY